MNAHPESRRASRPRRVRGAAMVEFIVLAMFVLVPMYLAVQAMGKLSDVRSAMNTAARYATWERTVWNQPNPTDGTTKQFNGINAPNTKSASQIRAEMMTRVFNDRGNPTFKQYKSTDKAATSLANGTDPMWEDTAGIPLVDDPATFAAAETFAAPKTDILGKVLALFGSISIPGVTGSVVPPLPSSTLATVQVNLNDVGKKSQVYQRLWSKAEGLPDDWAGLNYVAQGGILSNGWGANAYEGTQKMVKAAVPTAAGLGSAVNLATDGVIVTWDPTLATRLPDLGRVKPDIVSPDRLK